MNLLYDSLSILWKLQRYSRGVPLPDKEFGEDATRGGENALALKRGQKAMLPVMRGIARQTGVRSAVEINGVDHIDGQSEGMIASRPRSWTGHIRGSVPDSSSPSSRSRAGHAFLADSLLSL